MWIGYGLPWRWRSMPARLHRNFGHEPAARADEPTTGTRLHGAAANSVQVIDRQAIERTGLISLGDIVQQLPAGGAALNTRRFAPVPARREPPRRHDPCRPADALGGAVAGAHHARAAQRAGRRPARCVQQLREQLPSRVRPSGPVLVRRLRPAFLTAPTAISATIVTCLGGSGASGTAAAV